MLLTSQLQETMPFGYHCTDFSCNPHWISGSQVPWRTLYCSFTVSCPPCLQAHLFPHVNIHTPSLNRSFVAGSLIWCLCYEELDSLQTLRTFI